MDKNTTKVVSQLKKQLRTLAENEGGKAVFSRSNDLITIYVNKDMKILEVKYEKNEDSYVLFMNLESTNLSINLMVGVLEYFAELAKAENLLYAKFNMHQTRKSLNNPAQEYMLEAALNVMGYKMHGDILYVFKTQNQLNKVSDYFAYGKEALALFKVENPSFHFETAGIFPSANQNVFDGVFTAFFINWHGYSGKLGFKAQGEEYILEEVENELKGVKIRLNKVRIPKDNVGESSIKEAMFKYLSVIPEQMALPNALQTPHYQLSQFIYHLIKTDEIDTGEIMEKFEDLGYPFLEIEDECGRMLSDNRYLQLKRQEIPSYPLRYQISIHEAIIKFHRHYLILLKPAQMRAGIYDILDSKEKLESAIISLSKEIRDSSIIQ